MKPGDHQWQARQGRIGASDVPVLMGTVPWGSPREVYRRVLGLDGDDVREVTTRMRMGNMLEPVVLRALRWRGLVTIRCWRGYVHPTLPLSASPDAYARPWGEWPAGLVEVKATAARWMDQPPPGVMDQVQVQLMLTGRPVVHVAVLTGADLKVYPVTPDPIRQDEILETVALFVEEHLRPRHEPVDPPFQFTAAPPAATKRSS